MITKRQIASVNFILEIEDRRKILNLSQLTDEIERARGSASQLSDRMDASLAPDGALKDDSVGSAQIENGAVSFAQLSSTLVFDGEVSVPANSGSEVVFASFPLSAPFLPESPQRFYFVSVFYVAPLPEFPPPPPIRITSENSVTWTRKSSILRLRIGVGRFFTQQILVLENPQNIDISASCQVYSLSEI